MRLHFVHRHVQDTVVMLEEGNLPLIRYPWCDLQVSRKAINGRNLRTLQCKKGGGAETTTFSRDGDAGQHREGEVDLLHNHHGVVYMPLHKVHPHLCPCR